MLAERENEPEVRKSIGFLIFDGVYFTDIAVSRVVFEEANFVLSTLGQPPYYEIYSIGKKSEYQVSPSTKEYPLPYDSSEARSLSVLIVPGGNMNNVTGDVNIEKYISSTYDSLDILASVCGGAVALAHFGYLDGRKAATHPGGRYEEIEEKYGDQNIELIREPVVHDGKILTSGGVFKAADLALYIVEHHLGKEVKDKVVEEIRYFGEGKF